MIKKIFRFLLRLITLFIWKGKKPCNEVPKATTELLPKPTKLVVKPKKPKKKIKKGKKMPIKSESQRKWLHANKPAMAKRWEKETPKEKKLPKRVKKKKARRGKKK